MNDAEYEAQRERLRILSDRWIEMLGLRAWKIDFAYVRSDFTTDGAPAPDTVANCKTQWKYMDATISWNMPLVVDQDDRTLEYSFLHECMHIFLNELRPFRSSATSAENNMADAYDREHEEHVATMLGWAFLWTRENAMKQDSGG